MSRPCLDDVGNNADRAEEGEADGAPGDTVAPLVRPEIASKNAVRDDSDQRKHRNEFDQEVGHAAPNFFRALKMGIRRGRRERGPRGVLFSYVEGFEFSRTKPV